ncbi:hypothetical protein Tco_0184007 [Tanacetum coccineum]
MEGSYYSFPCSILSTWKDCKTPQRYPNVPTTSRRISLKSMNSFQGLTPKSPSSWHRSLAPKDLALYDNKSWNDPRDFGKPVKAISLPQDVSIISDHCLIELEHQVQRLMEAHIASRQPTQVNKITSSCEICSGPHDTQYCMENPEQAFLDYASSRISEMGNDMISKINLLWKTISEKLDDTPIRNTAGSPTAQMNFTSTNYPKKRSFEEDEAKEEGNVNSCTTDYKDHEVTVESEEEFEEETEEEIKEKEEDGPEYFDTFPTLKELRYHEWLLKNPRPPWVKAKIRTGNLNNEKDLNMRGMR